MVKVVKECVTNPDGSAEIKYSLNNPVPKKDKEELAKIFKKLNQIEAKEKCLRVQFLDWLSDKLLNWSNRVHVMAAKIDSPCLIEVQPRKKEDSQHAIASREISRLKELLEVYKDENESLWKQKKDMLEVIQTKVEGMVK